MPDFVFQQIVVTDRGDDLLTEELAELGPEAVGGGFHCPFGRAELSSGCRIGLSRLGGDEVLAERLKLAFFAGPGPVIGQAGKRLLDDALGPVALEEALGRYTVARLQAVAGIGAGEIE